MTLHQRIANLRTRVATLSEERREFNEVQALQIRYAELSDAVIPLVSAAKRCALFKEQGLLPKAMGKLADRLAKRVVILRDRFTADPRALTLTKGAHWQQMLNDAKEAVGVAQGSLMEAWRRHLEILFSGDRPADLESKLAPTEHNQGALARYRIAFNQLLQMRSASPDTAALFVEANKLVQELRAIHKTFDFNVPTAVKIFLQATGQGGAPLDLLTDEVREWLRNNNSYSRYSIVVRNDRT